MNHAWLLLLHHSRIWTLLMGIVLLHCLFSLGLVIVEQSCVLSRQFSALFQLFLEIVANRVDPRKFICVCFIQLSSVLSDNSLFRI